MTSPNFGRAMDLSALKNRAAPSGGAPGGGGAYVQDVTDVSQFEDALRKSLQHPVVVEFFSSRAEGGDQLSRDLAELANAAGGKWLLVRVNTDTDPQIAQALRIQAVPTVIAFIGGQPLPLFEGVYPKDQIAAVLDQVVQTATANGIVGTAQPVGPATPGGADQPADGDAQPATDPRFDAAYDAMEAGDFARAVEEFDKLLADTPDDAEAQAGRAQAGLLQRSAALTGDEVARADAAPDDVDAQFAAADAELVQGDAPAAFQRLVDLVRRTSGDERDRVRRHLLDLFETLGNSNPAVLTARRDLMTALF